MPILKRKVVRQINEIRIEERDETKETQTVLISPTVNYVICNKCGKDLSLRRGCPVSIECSSCGCPDFHTSMEFTVECVNCHNQISVKDSFCGYCAKCQSKIWKTF